MNSYTRLAPVLLLTALCASVDAAEKTDPPSALLAAAKQVMGGAAWDKVVTWHETGKITAGGLQGTYESWQDLTTLHNSGSAVLGPVSESQGWDGRRSWTTDNTKEVRIEASDEAVAQAIQDVLLSAPEDDYIRARCSQALHEAKTPLAY